MRTVQSEGFIQVGLIICVFIESSFTIHCISIYLKNALLDLGTDDKVSNNFALYIINSGFLDSSN